MFLIPSQALDYDGQDDLESDVGVFMRTAKEGFLKNSSFNAPTTYQH